MSRDGTVVVHEDAEVLAEAVAVRLINRLADAQARRGSASVALTGGRIAAKVYGYVLTSRIKGVVDWSKVDFWWGDERFLPSGDADRNETQARDAFLDALPVDPERVHPMPAADVVGTPEEAAAVYAAELDAAAQGAGVPPLDLVLLGVGEDGHVASLFPGDPALEVVDVPVAGVRESPKPPPERVTLTMPTINGAAEAWIIASGSGKAEAVGEALEHRRLPAGRVEARGRTRWLLDADAAADLRHLGL